MKFRFFKWFDYHENTALAYEGDHRYDGYIYQYVSDLEFCLSVNRRRTRSAWYEERIYYFSIKGLKLGDVQPESTGEISLHEFLIAQKLYDLILTRT